MFLMSDFSEWESGIANRNKFIFEEFLKREEIAEIMAVEFLPFNFKKGIKTLLRKQKGETVQSRPICKVTKKDYPKNVFAVKTVCNLVSERLMLRKVNKAFNKFTDQSLPAILWSYNPMYSQCFTIIPAEHTVFDAVDNWAEHASYKKYKKRLENNYEFIDQNAQTIFTVAKEQASMFPQNQNVHWIPNGIEFDKFSHPKQDKIVDQFFSAIKKPIIGYVGTIQERFDIDFMVELVKQNPDKSFVLVGPVWKGIEDEFNTKLKPLPNVYLTGRVNHDLVPTYIAKFDVGIIPHKNDAFIQSTNPMKMFEYLAAGKPVVGLPGSGLDMFPEFVKVVDTVDQFNQALDSAINDSQELKMARMSVIKVHSWEERVNTMIRHIGLQ